MKYAIIENGIVTNVVLADGPLADNWVETDTAGTGWSYADGVFTAPPEPIVHPVRTLTKLEYMNRFTDAELAAIYTTAKTVVQVEIWLEKFKAATEVNLDDPVTVAGLDSLEAVGLIGAGRSAEIRA